MTRRLAVFVVGVALVASACSTRVYTSERAVRDLERQSQLTHTQAACVVNTIRRHFETVIKASQKANKGSPLRADRLELEIDGALAALRAPTGAEATAARLAIARCAPGALH